MRNVKHCQAKKEGNKDVASKLEIVLQAAMSAKQSTLRPEIQLLNTLLSCKSAEERGQVSHAHI
jgi:hypothetical protein